MWNRHEQKVIFRCLSLPVSAGCQPGQTATLLTLRERLLCVNDFGNINLNRMDHYVV